MSRRRRNALAASFAVPALAVLVLTRADGPWAVFGAVAVGAVSTALAAVAISLARRRSVPPIAMALSSVVVPVVLGAVGFWVRYGSSEEAGRWIATLSLMALAACGLALLSSLLMPRRPVVTKVLCGVVLATTVPAGALLAVAQTADGRHGSWVDAFPGDGTARSATPEERAYTPTIEYHLVARAWDASGVDCADLLDVLGRHADAPTVRPEVPPLAPDVACAAETTGRWRATQAVLTRDGRLVVSAWSPTGELFVW
ncbi:hypothetical protein IFT73_17860 [Aeromicrobium sp. CFBP 8757]|uniref:hypothetical protein n=1 Tax=Aeromicrobium sp. CFBP 8757 TaxID=2775288 RepID=UPI00177ECADC|nr:hypothetical protein [Aeromicrobium sp. CFBP 8757]MBD8608725.1 hypothetical protein [Aeromicrobium sp. CFBP 8757]